MRLNITLIILNLNILAVLTCYLLLCSKKFFSKISYSLTLILDKIFQQGIFPDQCKIAKVVPIHKNGDVNDYHNYRPISILSTLSKIFEMLMLTRLISFINKNNNLCDGQYGFRPKHSTYTAVIDVANHITLSINSK